MFDHLYLKFVKWILLFLAITIFGSFWFIVAGYYWKKRHSRENKYPYLPVVVGVLSGLGLRYFCHLYYGPIVNGWVWMGVGLIGFLVTQRLASTKNKDVALSQKRERGNQLITPRAFQKLLDQKQDKYLVERHKKPLTPELMIGGIRLPNYLENLGFFFVGSPGSGKSVGIAELLYIARQRDDFRGIVFDRNGELTEKFFDPERDLIFNPIDARSVNWSHLTEQARPETIAAAIVPDDPKEPFFSDAARSLLSDLYERCSSNFGIWETLSKLSLEELTEFVLGGVSHRYFISDKTGGSVLSTLINFARFYKELPDLGTPFSFIEWARSEDSRWLFLPLFEEDSELYKPLYSAAFELALKGLLSNEGRSIKTAVVIDELGALNRLRSLSRLLSESRKFNGCPILGTQTQAQITKTYGEEDTQILLQGTATKLILNCRDSQTANTFADLIGKVDLIDTQTSRGTGPLDFLPWKATNTESITREVYTVSPSQLQSLPPLEGYLLIGDGTPSAPIRLTPRSYPNTAKRLVRRSSL